ncbi:hypothetical protein F4561_002960 [Lipingzhangella halophila]|uniref:Calpain catalytic domain-containing protein n=1 Tax=Lipingzhangella halophila TaxID=1783352 RepID=A0A7W7RHN3_9ACTN|nr:C2 family cysteine protease [Lipingzhangella halophila]MBB4932140.1 hypothetical protein [Lipingzhangella halophila]
MAAVVTITPIGDSVASMINRGICSVQGDTDCDSAEVSDASDSSDSDPSDEERPIGFGKPVNDEEWGDRETTPLEDPPPLTDEEIEAGQDAAEDLRDALEYDGAAWYNPGSWFGPDSPADIINELTPGEIRAALDELDDDEIRELLEDEGAVDALLVRADLHLLNELNELAPDSVEPNISDVRTSDGDMPNNPAVDYGYVDHDLFGDDGPVVENIFQGSIADCWWMASMGALAHENPEVIEDMIEENANGTFTVTFPDGENVTVTPFFPEQQNGHVPELENGDIAYAQPAGNAMWPMVLEKAMAERAGGYNELVGGNPGTGMEDLTGADSEFHDGGDVSQSDLESWLDEDQSVTLLTPSEDDAEGALYDDGTLVPWHSYVVQSMDDSGNVTLYNPHGPGREVTIHVDQLDQVNEVQNVDPE